MLGGYKRVEKIMTALLLVILACFIIVAIKGLADWRTWLALGGGLVPQIPADLPVVGSDKVAQRLHAGDGDRRQGLAPAVFLSYGYLARQRRLHRGRHQAVVLEDGAEPRRDLGPVLGHRHRRRRDRTARRLQRVRARPILGVSHYSQIESIPVAGQVLGPALPGALGFLAPRLFSLGLVRRRLHHADLGGVDDDVFLPRHRAARTGASPTTTRRSRCVFAAWIAIPALVAPFWQLPALLKAIIAMVGNLLMAPIAVAVILYFVNRRELGEFRANAGRNLLLASR